MSAVMKGWSSLFYSDMYFGRKIDAVQGYFGHVLGDAVFDPKHISEALAITPEQWAQMYAGRARIGIFCPRTLAVYFSVNAGQRDAFAIAMRRRAATQFADFLSDNKTTLICTPMGR